MPGERGLAGSRRARTIISDHPTSPMKDIDQLPPDLPLCSSTSSYSWLNARVEHGSLLMCAMYMLCRGVSPQVLGPHTYSLPPAIGFVCSVARPIPRTFVWSLNSVSISSCCLLLSSYVALCLYLLDQQSTPASSWPPLREVQCSARFKQSIY